MPTVVRTPRFPKFVVAPLPPTLSDVPVLLTFTFTPGNSYSGVQQRLDSPGAGRSRSKAVACDVGKHSDPGAGVGTHIYRSAAGCHYRKCSPRPSARRCGSPTWRCCGCITTIPCDTGGHGSLPIARRWRHWRMSDSAACGNTTSRRCRWGFSTGPTWKPLAPQRRQLAGNAIDRHAGEGRGLRLTQFPPFRKRALRVGINQRRPPRGCRRAGCGRAGCRNHRQVSRDG